MTNALEQNDQRVTITPASRVERILAATAAVFGLLVSGGVFAIVVAGLLQWGPAYPDWLDDGLPLLVLAIGMLLAGRVAVDVAGPRGGLLAALLAAVLLGVLGYAVSRSSEAHGDGVEVGQVLLAVLVVMLLAGGSAALVGRRRARRARRARANRGAT
jgi:hypothetical protein